LGVVQQAPLLDGLALDAFTLEQDGLAAAEVGVGRGQVVQALVVALVVVVLDEGRDLRLELAGQVVVLEQDPVLQGLMPAFDLALGLRVARRAADMLDAVGIEPLGQLARDVAWPVVGQQPGAVPDARLGAA
jgi:hypothetical protein